MRYSSPKLVISKLRSPSLDGVDPGLRAQAQARSTSTNTCFLGSLVFQEDSQRMREEIESLHRKFEALKRFAAQKKVRLPLEFDQQAAYMWKKTKTKQYRIQIIIIYAKFRFIWRVLAFRCICVWRMLVFFCSCPSLFFEEVVTTISFACSSHSDKTTKCGI